MMDVVVKAWRGKDHPNARITTLVWFDLRERLSPLQTGGPRQVRECQRQWGVTPRPYWAAVSYGGREIAAASNIVFSNGEMDPWSGGGVLNSISDTLVAVTIRDGAHHNDLMWSDPHDPPSVLRARALEREHMWRWVRQARQRQAEAPVRRPAHVSEEATLPTFH